MTDMTIKTPGHLWFVGVIAVLFNAIGAFDYVMNMAQGGSYMASHPTRRVISSWNADESRLQPLTRAPASARAWLKGA